MAEDLELHWNCTGSWVLLSNMPKLAPVGGFFRAVFGRNVSYLTQHLLPGGSGPVFASQGYFSFQKVSTALNFERPFR